MTRADLTTIVANLRKPADGTKVRATFDRLILSAGNTVRLDAAANDLRQLEQRYGLRITRRADGRYILRGVFHTDFYTDLRTGKVSRVADLSRAEFERLFSTAS